MMFVYRIILECIHLPMPAANKIEFFRILRLKRSVDEQQTEELDWITIVFSGVISWSMTFQIDEFPADFS